MPDLQSIERLVDQVTQHYGVDRSTVRVLFAPYRICPLGAHIDHQLGPVTAMALDRGVLLAYAPLPTPEARMRSLNFPGEVRFPFTQVPDARPGDWGNYLRGAVRALQQHHRLDTGLVGVTQGSVAEGGLSSSAAVGVAYLLALEDVNGLQVAPEENILLDQVIENTYLGLRNGVLDQSAILLSRRGHLTRIDCATLHHELVPFPSHGYREPGPFPLLPPVAILIAFSGLRQALVTTDYNRRVAECAEAARTLLATAGRAGEPPLLGLVSDDEYAADGERLSGPPARRAAHFFSERARVGRGVDAWRRGDLHEFGRLITASGDSSIRNYQCGAPPLVDLYQLLVEADGVYGARFSGAGFRGCCLALVDPERADAVAAEVAAAYGRHYPDLAEQAQMMICQSDDGARRVSS